MRAGPRETLSTKGQANETNGHNLKNLLHFRVKGRREVRQDGMLLRCKRQDWVALGGGWKWKRGGKWEVFLKAGIFHDLPCEVYDGFDT